MDYTKVESTFINKVEFKDNEQWIAARVYEEGNGVCIVSNKSYSPDLHIRASVWIITTRLDQQKFIIGNNLIPGNPDTLLSYRSELGGLIGGLVHWK